MVNGGQREARNSSKRKDNYTKKPQKTTTIKNPHCFFSHQKRFILTFVDSLSLFSKGFGNCIGSLIEYSFGFGHCIRVTGRWISRNFWHSTTWNGRLVSIMRRRWHDFSVAARFRHRNHWNWPHWQNGLALNWCTIRHYEVLEQSSVRCTTENISFCELETWALLLADAQQRPAVAALSHHWCLW